MPTLFEPLIAGDLHLSNRIVMSSLTRCRAEDGRVPGALAVEYYRQRASAGLIISEGTVVTPGGVGFADTPGIWSAAQIAGWRQVTDAVHAAGGTIVCQLWHCGRQSHMAHLDGATPVAPSAVAAAGHVRLLRPVVPHPVPRALETAEIPGIVEAFRQGAANARAAGFDGVELHAANGYLIDTFLQDKTNKRDDRYGGSIENRMRFLLDVVDAVSGVWGAGRVGVHLTPRCDVNDMGDSNPAALFTAVARALKDKGVAFLCLRERLKDDSLLGRIKAEFGGVVIANEDLTPASAAQLVAEGAADAAAFGRAFIANPDLVARIRAGAALNTPDPETFYGRHHGARGFTDYPALPAGAI
jgi:2,4-dienoyl-CoA reductase-like NADH-dependent reductase (Old Yellow Enzyme family)